MKVAPSAMVAFPMRFSAPSTWPMIERTDLAVKVLVDGAKLNASQGPAGALDAAGAPRRRVTMRGIIVIVVVYRKFLRSLKKMQRWSARARPSSGDSYSGYRQLLEVGTVIFKKLVNEAALNGVKIMGPTNSSHTSWATTGS